MDNETGALRCVGCRQDVPYAGDQGKCPHCEYPIAESIRRWKRFVDRDEGTVRGALLTIAIGCVALIPFAVVMAVTGGFVDPVEAQRDPFGMMTRGSTLFIMLGSCGMFLAEFVMALAWLLLLVFSIRGVTHRVVFPIATAAIGVALVSGGGMIVGIVISTQNLGNQEQQSHLLMLMSVFSATVSSVFLYFTLAWAMDALGRSFHPKVPRGAALWATACVLSTLVIVGSVMFLVDAKPQFESSAGTLRAVLSGAANVALAILILFSVIEARRTACELANRHRALKLGSDRLAANRNAPPSWNAG